MWPLILFIVLIVVVLTLIEINERRKKSMTNHQSPTTNEALTGLTTNSRPEGCCGEHLVCEKETLLQTNAEVVYYDDEELDVLAGLKPENWTEAQQEAVRQVFRTLDERDVPGWCRSLQLRGIELPPDIREEALLIVKEQRATKSI